MHNSTFDAQNSKRVNSHMESSAKRPPANTANDWQARVQRTSKALEARLHARGATRGQLLVGRRFQARVPREEAIMDIAQLCGGLGRLALRARGPIGKVAPAKPKGARPGGSHLPGQAALDRKGHPYAYGVRSVPAAPSASSFSPTSSSARSGVMQISGSLSKSCRS